MRGTGPILVAVTIVACHADGPAPSADGGGTCGAGLTAVGKACMPVLDRCAADEVPLPGGGCKRVGIRECHGGLAGPPDWKCKPIGPPTTCKAGWKRTPRGWCEPVLPPGPCPAGSRAVLGKSTCQPFGDCGTGTWGEIKTTASTIFVDGSYAGGNENGSQTRPYSTIQKALNTTLAGAHVAVAAGTYAEDLSIASPWVRLEGRCTKMVRLVGDGAPDSLALKIWVGGVTVKGISVSSSYLCIVSDGRKVTIEDVEVRDCGEAGIKFFNGSATVRDTVVHDSVVHGIAANKSDLNPAATAPVVTLERVVVDGTKPAGISSDWNGIGVLVNDGEVRMRDSLVTRTSGVGVSVWKGKVSLERSVVSSTVEDKVKLENYFTGQGLELRLGSTGALRDALVKDSDGTGVLVTSDSSLLMDRSVVANTRTSSRGDDGNGFLGVGTKVGSPKITVRDSLVEESQGTGVFIWDAEAVIERSVVRDTRRLNPPTSGGYNLGYGISAVQSKSNVDRQTLTLRDSLVAGNASHSVVVDGCKATLERVVVRDTRIGETSTHRVATGIGAWAQDTTGLRPTLTLRDSLVTGNRLRGLYAESADVSIERTVISDTVGDRSGYPTNGYGVDLMVGLARNGPTKLTIMESVVTNSRIAGIRMDGAKVVIKGSVVRNTRPSDRRGYSGFGILGHPAEVKQANHLASYIDIYDSVVENSHATGVSILAGRVRVHRSIIRGTLKDGRGYGDGLTAEKYATLFVADSLVDDNARSGILFYGGGGAVIRSVIRGNKVPLALDLGATPTLGDDNVYLDNAENAVVRGRGFKPAKLPSVVPPPSP